VRRAPRGYHGNDARRRRAVRDLPSAVAAPSVIPLKITDFWLLARRRAIVRGDRVIGRGGGERVLMAVRVADGVGEGV